MERLVQRGNTGMGGGLLASKAFSALVLFALTFAVSGFSIQERQQLGSLSRMTDEWYLLGANLITSGTLGLSDDPFVLRPPGYPAFIAAAMRLLAGSPGPLSLGYLERGVHAVYLAQSLVLSATVVTLFLWLAGFVRRRVAFVSALALGLNPYSIVLVGLLHYDVLHVFFIVAGGWALGSAFARGGSSGTWRMLLAGVVWGLATLVRPASLLLPLFVLAVLSMRRSGSLAAAIRATVLFALGLGAVVAPWTIRNYRVSGRLIPVNDQAWAVIWGSTTKPLGVHPNHYKWASLTSEMMGVFSKVTGRREYDYLAYVRSNGTLEAAFRAEALRNIRRAPQVYLGNAVSSALALSMHVNSVFIKAFQYQQTPGAEIRPSWFRIGDIQDFYPGGASRAFAAYNFVMTALAGCGLWVAFRRRNPYVLGPATVFLCFIVGHAITYMDLMYYYQRIPFLFVFASFFVDAGQTRSLRIPVLDRRVDLGWMLLAAVGSGVLLTPFVLA